MHVRKEPVCCQAIDIEAKGVSAKGVFDMCGQHTFRSKSEVFGIRLSRWIIAIHNADQFTQPTPRKSKFKN